MTELNSPLAKKGIVFSHLLILSLFVAVYIGLIVKYCWSLPFPSDPTLYLGPVVFKSFVGHFHAVDRLMIPISIYFFSFIFSKVYVAGMVYMGFVNCLILILGIFFCYRRGGMISAVFFSILAISSYFFTGFATYIYPIQTEALYCLLALICFTSHKSKWFNPVFCTGFFCVLAFFSKITAIATIMFFVIYLLIQKRQSELISFFLGGIFGATVVLAATVLIFGYESLVYVFTGFHGYVDKAMTARGSTTNIISYLKLLLSQKTLPVFLSLFVFLGAYRLSKSRDVFLMALAHFGVLYFVYTFSTRGGPIIDNYGYTIFLFTSLGVALYLGSLFEDGVFKSAFLNRWEKKTSFVSILGISLLLLLMAGLAFGLKYNPNGIFNISWKVNFPAPVRWLYTLGPITVLALLTIVEYSKRKSTVIILMFVVTFWCSAYSAGLGFHKVDQDRRGANFFYEAAELLNDVPQKRFSVYISGWTQLSDRLPVKRILRIYRLFFDKKYKRDFARHDSHNRNKEIVEESMEFIQKPEMLALAKWPYILTDDHRAVGKYYPNAILIEKMTYYNNFIFLFRTN